MIQGIPDKNLKQILQFWTKEKHIIFDMIQRKGTQYNEIDELNWSVNVITYGKHVKNMREPTSIVDIKVIEKSL